MKKKRITLMNHHHCHCGNVIDEEASYCEECAKIM